MRRLLALVTVMLLVHAASGCRHVAGACDCEHAINPSYTSAAGTSGHCAGGNCGKAVPVPVAYERGTR